MCEWVSVCVCVCVWQVKGRQKGFIRLDWFEDSKPSGWQGSRYYGWRCYYYWCKVSTPFLLLGLPGSYTGTRIGLFVLRLHLDRLLFLGFLGILTLNFMHWIWSWIWHVEFGDLENISFFNIEYLILDLWKCKHDGLWWDYDNEDYVLPLKNSIQRLSQQGFQWGNGGNYCVKCHRNNYEDIIYIFYNSANWILWQCEMYIKV